jgi:hypothetical protein
MGKAGKWIKGIFKGAKVPKPPTNAPTAGDLYSGPRAFSDYRPEGANVQGDAAGREAAVNALRQIQGVAQTGTTPQQSAQMASFLRQGQQATAGVRQAALQGAAARGTASGGAGLLAGLAGGQQDANAAADAAAGMATQAENRRYDAMNQAANLGMNLDQSKFAQGASNAAAMDDFNQWASGMQMNAAQGGFDNSMTAYGAQRQYAADKRAKKMAFFNAIKDIGMTVANAYTGGAAGMATSALGAATAAANRGGGGGGGGSPYGGRAAGMTGGWDEG